jgi:murein L,D-transpeptidase YafK
MDLQHRNPAANRMRSLLALLCLSVGAAEADSIATTELAERMPAYLLEVPESVTNVLVADTTAATLYHFTVSANRIVAQDERYMSIGQNGVGKKRAWDRKTPLGVYFITKRLDTSKLDAKYGVAAFPLDYPNAWDQYRERTGDGIWLHGVDRSLSRRPAMDTDGCLALPNDELLSLAGHLQPMETPVIVARALHWLDRAEVERNRLEFRIVLDMWRQSMEQQDLVAYLSLYDDGFRHRGMDKNAWSAFRLGAFSARPLTSVEISNVLLLADPEEPDLYLSRFTQVTTGADGSVRTTKRLYWKRISVGQWRIVAEDNG